MPSLVLELQQVAMDPKHKIGDLLRKAYAVSAKLRLNDFREWCQCELNGYEGRDVPPYRQIKGEMKAWNPCNGWIPVMISNTELMERLCHRSVTQPIAELEQLCGGGPNETLQMPFSHETLMRVFGHSEELRLGIVPTIVVGNSQIYGILEAIRNTVLNWSLELEAKGILGEGITFSQDEVQMASQITYNINKFSGVLGNVTSSEVQVGDYNTIHSELKQRGIAQSERNELEQILDELPKASPSEKKTLAQRGMAWVMRNAPALGTLSDTIRAWFAIF